MLNYHNGIKEEIIQTIKERAAYYVPEWRFDEKNPDIGTALALVYSELHAKTVMRYERIPEKYRIAFLNLLGANLLPTVPAQGYVAFGLVNQEVEGSYGKAGILVIAETENETLTYETLEDVYVTPVMLECIYQVLPEQDSISCIFNKDQPENEIVIFEKNKKNLQAHEIYFGHEDALNIKRGARIELEYLRQGKQPVQERYLEYLMDEDNVIYEYYSENGFVSFQNRYLKAGILCFSKEENQPPFQKTIQNEKEGYWIRCLIKNTDHLKNFAFNSLLMQMKSSHIVPDSIFANGVETGHGNYYPFGEQLSVYNEVYFGSEEVLSKKGAEITLTFTLHFIKAALEYQTEEAHIQWEWFMKKANIKQEKEYDVTIEYVLWEYYNGSGFTRLFPDDRHSDIFSSWSEEGERYKKISFICPEDIKPLLINSNMTYYIRARILKINNQFKMRGNYRLPCMGNTMFSYDYKDKKLKPSWIVMNNNMEKQGYIGNNGSGVITPFSEMDTNKNALYLGFDKELTRGPIRILFTLKENINRREAKLIWECYDGHNWRQMNQVDETENLSKTGIVTLIGNQKYGKKKLYGKEMYWIRILDEKEQYGNDRHGLSLPCITGIYMNGVRVRHLNQLATEYLHMEAYQKNRKFKLKYNKVYDIKLYVNELHGLSEGEKEELKKKLSWHPVYDESGVMTELWVEWECKENFLFSESKDRHYILDSVDGGIQFGDGRNGKIPPVGIERNIKIIYRTGGGEHTNVEEGTINKMNQTIGFINKVTNPEPFTGGNNIETLEQSLKRNSSLIKHQNKGVTVSDLEELSIVASRKIRKVKCFTGFDDKGDRTNGVVTLVVLQKDFEYGNIQFDGVRHEIESGLKDKMPEFLLDRNRFFIVEPKFIMLQVRMEVIAKHLNDAFDVKEKVYEKLDKFLNPLTGNFDGRGWDIGILPNCVQMKNAVNDIQGIRYIKKVNISAFTVSESGYREVDPDKIRESRYVLPISGIHDITVSI